MKINVINFAELCDRSFASMLTNPKTYCETETGIYVPPPNKDARQRFNYVMNLFIEKLTDKQMPNLIVRSCLPSENWRLRHVGRRFNNMIKDNRMVSVKRSHDKPFEIGSGWDNYFNEYFKNLRARKIEVPEADFKDVISVLQISETLKLSDYKAPICLMDVNELIEHADVKIPKFVISNINRQFMEAMAEK